MAALCKPVTDTLSFSQLGDRKPRCLPSPPLAPRQ